MYFTLHDDVIRRLCGSFAYEDGEAIVKAHSVTVRQYDAGRRYEGHVYDEQEMSLVTVDFPPNGEIEANCSCPVFHPDDQYCKHIAAVLLHIHHAEPHAFTFPDDTLTKRMLALFDDTPVRPTCTLSHFDTRTALQAIFTVKPFRHPGHHSYRFGLELKLGLQRLYSVRQVKDFLACVEKQSNYIVTKQFTYDPKIYSFLPEQDAVLQALLHMLHQQKFYHTDETGESHTGALLPIEPIAWDSLLRLLCATPGTQLTYNAYSSDIEVIEGALPLLFTLDRAADDRGYELQVQGLHHLLILEQYSTVLAQGKLYRLPHASMQRLVALMELLENAHRGHLYIAPEQIETLLDKVIPALMQFGRVDITETLSEHMIRTPLQAKLFLDRLKDRLLASLEFHYGDIILNPLDQSGPAYTKGHLLLRDSEKERLILELMAQSPFLVTEGGYILADEEEEFTFLYQIVPELKKHLQIYATSAVKSRLHVQNAPPHIDVNLEEHTNWLTFTFDIDGIPESEIRAIIRSMEEKRKYHRLPTGTLMPLQTAELQDMNRLLQETELEQLQIDGNQIRMPMMHGMHLTDFSSNGSTIRFGKSFRQLLNHMRNPDHLEFPLPDTLTAVLRDYQSFGFQWMKTLAHYRFGGILADEMGLGKTVQAIAFVASVLPDIREAGTPALIVCTSSLMYNWLLEVRKFAPTIRVTIADGSKTERVHLLKQVEQYDIILTSYPLLRRDIEQYAPLSFHTLLLDEAQAFKNDMTKTAQAVKMIRAPYRFALSGTPLENQLDEIWSIYDVVFPGLFPDKKRFHDLPRDTITKRIRPFLLRRLKKDVLKELPDKIETVQTAPLFIEQQKLYTAYLAELREKSLQYLYRGEWKKQRIRFLAGLTRLRQLCCHPALFIPGYTGGSAKLLQLLDIVAAYRHEGRRMLIFSQFTKMLHIIRQEMVRRDIPYFYLDGQTATQERVELCNRFNDGERDLFLISLKAGGTGLNLTGADTIILYDLWWNPAVEQQATDRAHRIGQKQVVHVIRLVAQGTVEEKMYTLQERKKDLIEDVIRPSNSNWTGLTEDDIRELLM